MIACRSYRFGGGFCADGFPQRALCAGHAGCPACGHTSDNHLPLCLGDAVPPHILDDAGRPRHTHHIKESEG
jgi:hypothetical protein